MNFKKLLLIVVPLLLAIFAWQFFTKVDRGDPVAVGNAFTKALKSGSASKAAKYYDPAGAEAWQENFDGLKSGATERMLERVPSEPGFSAPVTSKTGVTTLVSADKSYILEIKQIDGKWYVTKAPGG